jgi:hypothetical protein
MSINCNNNTVKTPLTDTSKSGHFLGNGEWGMENGDIFTTFL